MYFYYKLTIDWRDMDNLVEKIALPTSALEKQKVKPII